MTENDRLEREAYDEQAFEMRANGMPVPTFAEWKERNERIRAFLKAQAGKVEK